MSFTTIAQNFGVGSTDSRAYLDNYVNAVVKVVGVPGIAGFLFDVADRESVNVTWDVTDHYTESNSFLNDHKVKGPVTVTLSGFIGELVHRKPEGLGAEIQNLINRLETVEAYAGDSTPGATQDAQRALQQTRRTISAINQTLDKAKNIVGLFSGFGPQETEQQIAYRTLVSLGNEAIITIQTPWEFFSNMTIMAVTATQEEGSDQITDFSVTAKEIRISQVKTADFSQDQLPIREQVQSAPGAFQGAVRGQDTSSSLLFKAFG